MERPGPATGPQECWTEQCSGALIGAWGPRFVQLNRGILRRNDWKQIADAVNEARQVDGYQRHTPLASKPLTDFQCRNRVDTLKKRYNLERSKLPSPSTWPFYFKS